MSDYIERKSIKYEQWPVGPLYEPIMVVRKKTIDKIPSADVAQVVHGRWILRGRKILCSCCNALFEEVEEKELFEVKADLPYLREIEKYCFNCGAKMDLDG